MIRLCSRFDSVLFTPKMSEIPSYGNYSRSPIAYRGRDAAKGIQHEIITRLARLTNRSLKSSQLCFPATKPRRSRTLALLFSPARYYHRRLPQPPPNGRALAEAEPRAEARWRPIAHRTSKDISGI